MERLPSPLKATLEAEALRLIALGLTAEAAWARIASYALAKQSEAAVVQARRK